MKNNLTQINEENEFFLDLLDIDLDDQFTLAKTDLDRAYFKKNSKVYLDSVLWEMYIKARSFLIDDWTQPYIDEMDSLIDREFKKEWDEYSSTKAEEMSYEIDMLYAESELIREENKEVHELRHNIWKQIKKLKQLQS